MKVAVINALMAIVGAASTPALATPPLIGPEWPPSGLSVVQKPGYQFVADVLADGNGGMFVAWVDWGGGDDRHIRLQRVDMNGHIEWWQYPTGFPVCTAPGSQYSARLISDGAGGVIAAWYDLRGSSADIYAVRVVGNGSVFPSWPVDGVAICTAPGTQMSPILAPDAGGGAFIAWTDFRDGAGSSHVYIQRVLDTGATAVGWPVDGIRVPGGAGLAYAIVPDPEGGVFVTWVRARTPAGLGEELIATRITSSGGLASGWPDSGLVMCSAAGARDNASIVSDQQGGFYAVWRDYRDETSPFVDGESDIYCQRVTGAGGFPPGWGGDGLPVRTGPGDEGIPNAASDAMGGLLVAWKSDAFGTPSVVVQRITGAGTVAAGWDPRGVSTGANASSGSGAIVAGDGTGGAIVAWTDMNRSNGLDIYARHITAGGTVAEGWEPTGTAVSTAPGNHLLPPTMVTDGRGGVLLAWIDEGASGGADVYAQRITAQGVVGPRACFGCDGIAHLSPNPSRGRFRLEVRGPNFGSGGTLRVYDATGRLRRTKRVGSPTYGTAVLDLDLSDFSSGVYFIKYSAGSRAALVGTRRLTIVR